MSQEYDVVIIGSGFGGIYSLIKLRREGYKCRVVEKEAGLGGTWYTNRYPGAMSDSEAHLYRYTFDKEFSLNYPWRHKFIRAPDALKYLQDVAEHYDCLKDMQFDSRVEEMTFHEDKNQWEVKTKQGTLFGRYVVAALGLVNEPNFAKIPGRDTFKGQIFHTARWPENVDLKGKRVGLIGSGSTGTQIVSELSKPEIGLKSLITFQRSPQYCVPARDGPVDQKEVDEMNAQYDEKWKLAKTCAFGLDFENPTRSIFEVDEAERKRVFDHAWKRGSGFYFLLGTFNDLTISEEANELACQYIRERIKETVKDPEKARKLTPHNIHGRRPIQEHNYYEAFNQDNVDVVLLTETPLETITEKGIKCSDKEYELDIIIFATGYQALEGNYNNIVIKGKGGKLLKEYWTPSPSSFAGAAIPGFPNLCMLLGVGGPFSNIPPLVEIEVDWVAELFNFAKGRSIEATPEAAKEWMDGVSQVFNMLVFSKVESWITGKNVGKQGVAQFYMAGTPNFEKALHEIRDKDFAGFTFTDKTSGKVEEHEPPHVKIEAKPGEAVL